MRFILIAFLLSACTAGSPESDRCQADLAVDGRDVIVWQLPIDVETVSVHLFAQYAVSVQCWIIPPGAEPVTVVDRIIYGSDDAYAYTARYSGGVLMCSGFSEWIQYGDPVVTCSADDS